MGKLVESSPQLQASVLLLKKSLEFILRPIGDVIGLALRPFALLMIRFAINFYKNALPVLQGLAGDIADQLAAAPGVEAATAILEDIGKPSEEILKTQKAIAEVTESTATFSEKLAKLIPLGVREALTAAGEAFGGLLVVLKSIGTFLFEVFKPVLAILGLALIGLLKVITFAFLGLEFILQLIAVAFEFATIAVKILWDTIIGWTKFLVGKAIEGISKLASRFKLFFGETLPQAFEDAKTKVGEIIDSIKTKISTGIQFIADKFTDFIDNLKSILPRFLGGGTENNVDGDIAQDFIMRGNKIQKFSPQDTVMGFKGDMPGGGKSVSITVQVMALDPSSINDTILRKITDEIQRAQQRGVMSRTMQATGV